MKYKLIYGDPPWRHDDRADSGKRGAAHKYKTMSLTDLIAMKPQIDQWADKDCALCIWAVFPMLPEAFALLTAWGFKYRTIPFVWVKTNERALTRFREMLRKAFSLCGFGFRASVADKIADHILGFLGTASIYIVSLFWGMGHWTRANAEVVLLGTRGRPPRLSKGVHSVVVSVIREHSQKPNEVRIRLLELFGDVSRIELFARDRSPGWDAHGDELPEEIESLEVTHA